MNERIKELLTKSGYDARYCSEDFDPEKFAEMIVRECMIVVRSSREKICGAISANNLKEHFGVEE